MRLDAAAVGPLEVMAAVGIAVLVVVIVMLAVVLVRLSPSRRDAGAEQEVAAAPGPAAPVDGPLTPTVSPTVSSQAPGAPEPAAVTHPHDVVAPFVDVARRDQSLLNRQLELLDSLERSEDDPEVLMNLFQLDNLATRMRRNAESLLVLADAEPGRRVRSTMPLSDVLRTAASQIEHYDRVVLDLADDPVVLGHHVLPVAHLLAELLENATTFSAPTSVVEVADRTVDGAVTITVLDSGLGMSEAEKAEARTKVEGSVSTSEVGLQRLGLHVVGQLALRVGAAVSFHDRSGTTGTEVAVVLPATVFAQAHAPGPLGATESALPARPRQQGQQSRPVPAEQSPFPGLTGAEPAALPAVHPGAATPASLIGMPPGLAAAVQADSETTWSPTDAPGLPLPGRATQAASVTPAPSAGVAPASSASSSPVPSADDLPTSEPDPTRPGPVRRTVRRPGRGGSASAPPPQGRTQQTSLPMRPRTGATPVAAPVAATPPSREQRSSMFASFRSAAEIEDPAPHVAASALEEYVVAVTASGPGSGSASSLPDSELFSSADRDLPRRPVRETTASDPASATAQHSGSAPAPTSATTELMGGPIEQSLIFDTAHLSERLAWMRAVEDALEDGGPASPGYQPRSEAIGAPADLMTRTPHEVQPESFGRAGQPGSRPDLGRPVLSQDAHQIRARLSSFQSASSRGREEASGGARRRPAGGVHPR